MRIIKIWLTGTLMGVFLTTGSAFSDVALLEKTGSAFSKIAKEALPAVVFINVESTVEVPQQTYRYHPLEEFFGQGSRNRAAVPEKGRSRTFRQEGQGSGFIISKEGYILTNNHVVNDADRIKVTLGDGREFEAKLIGTDPKTEVALIKIDDHGDFPILELGDSDALDVGEWVLAAGNPFGLSQTLTAGIVSAKGRDETGITEFGNFIQTDAAINPGNSGGPMLNIHGQVVGINTAIYTQTGGYMGIGFAIPINMAVQIKDQLIQHGKVSRSVLGVYLQEVDEDLAKSFGLDETEGILVAQVVADSAAEEAGMEGGDIIMEMNGTKVSKLARFRNQVAATPPKTTIDLKIFRDGKALNIKAITKELGGSMEAEEEPAPEMVEKLGMTVENIDEEMAERLGGKEVSGVVITSVEQGGSSWQAGLQPGHVISSANRKAVSTVAEFKSALADSWDQGKILLLVRDGRSSRFIIITVD
jgi:serine protease Do